MFHIYLPVAGNSINTLAPSGARGNRRLGVRVGQKALRFCSAMASWWQRWFGRRRGEDLEALRGRYDRFRHLLDGNNLVLELIADTGEKSGGGH